MYQFKFVKMHLCADECGIWIHFKQASHHATVEAL
jgi:hypothetical protein